jgi:hypothetical protein
MSNKIKDIIIIDLLVRSITMILEKINNLYVKL